MTRGERRGHTVPAVPDDETVAVASEPHRRSLHMQLGDRVTAG